VRKERKENYQQLTRYTYISETVQDTDIISFCDKCYTLYQTVTIFIFMATYRHTISCIYMLENAFVRDRHAKLFKILLAFSSVFENLNSFDAEND